MVGPWSLGGNLAETVNIYKSDNEFNVEVRSNKDSSEDIKKETLGLKELVAYNQEIKKDIEDLELAIQKLEQEKTNRDHILRTLNDEISEQDEVLNKLNKEKKHAADNQSKAQEDFQSAEDIYQRLDY